MANVIVKITEQKTKGDWCNIKTEGGKEVAINLKSAVKVAEQIASGKTEIEMNIVESKGKLYGWDKQEQKQGGFKQLTPEQLAAKQQREDHTQRMIVAQNSVTNAVQYYQQRQGDVNSVKVLAKEFYNLVMELSK